MRQTKIVGTGITAREVDVIDVKNGGEEALQRVEENFSYLIEASKRPGGYWLLVTEAARATCENILKCSSVDKAMEYETDSDEDFAFRISKELRIVDKNIEELASSAPETRKVIEEIARFAFAAGCNWQAFYMKCAWEEDALRGEKVAGGSKNAAGKRTSANEKLMNKRFARFRELLPQMKLTKAALQCEIEGLGQSGAILRQWHRELKRQRCKKMDT